CDRRPTVTLLNEKPRGSADSPDQECDRAFADRQLSPPLDTSQVRSPHMSRPDVVFDPFSDEYFNDPYPIYLRMQDETPVYYSEQFDFYALTRHADVAAALK